MFIVMQNQIERQILAATVLLFLAGCSGQTSGGPALTIPPRYATLPDTVACVVDRAAPRGLRNIPAKVEGDQIVVLMGNEIVPLESVHPVNVIAGYAGREGWLVRGDPLNVDGSRFARTGGERRVAAELLRRSGEHQGILLFAGDEDEPPPDALYVPTAPGCIFQPYVREDLIRR